jgi:hypothetical protein
MNGGDPLVLTLELSGRAEPIEGTVRRPDQSTDTFNGWSELFAVLQRITSSRIDQSATPGP